jgi:F-type H+-transporting ATPase subunit delta
MPSAFASRYARAFADVVTSAHLNTAAIETQLNDLLGTWDGSVELRSTFENPAIPAVQKIVILDKLNAGIDGRGLGLQKELRNLIAVLIHNDRIAHVKEVVAAYRAEMEERQGIRQAEITTARELGDDEKATLLAGVGRLAGAKIRPTFKLDKEILGGTVVRIGSTVYDGSVRGRLERLKEVLVAG